MAFTQRHDRTVDPAAATAADPPVAAAPTSALVGEQLGAVPPAQPHRLAVAAGSARRHL